MLFLNNMQLRCICTSARLQASKIQLGRIVNKVFTSDNPKKSRKKHLFPNSSTVPDISFVTSKITIPTHKSRRVVVLNKIFMKCITDLMSTGEVASELVGKGIEVTGTKISPDYKIVNVFWISENENENKNIEKALKSSAGHLQHELSQLRVIGQVPTINFVKDKQYFLAKEVESRLSKVDFGEDYIPTAYIRQKPIPTIKTSLSDTIKDQLSKLSVNENEEDEFHEIIIPEMKQDVLGFDHSYIMKKVKISLNKTRISKLNNTKSSLENSDTIDSSDSRKISETTYDFLSKKDQDQLFEDFLKKRKINKQREKSVSLHENRIENEDWHEEINDDFDMEINDEEKYRDEYKEIESYHK